MKTIIKRVTPVMKINPVVQAIVFLLCLLGIISLGHAAGGKETVTYYHHDALGSVVAATNQQGQVIWREEYKPLGARMVKDTASQHHRVWYTGHTEEQALGLVYMGARWYHPEIGQFLSIDPVGFNEENPQSFNRYAYANQNPYKFVDPDGRLPVVPALAAITAFIATNNAQAPTSAGDLHPNMDVKTFATGAAITGGAAALLRSGSSGVTEAGVANTAKTLGANPFKGNNAEQVAEMLTKKGYVPKGADPAAGRGTYVNPKTGRGYHIDAKHPEPKGPHVGVHRPRDMRDTMETRDYPMGGK